MDHEPETRNPKPEALNHEPDTRHPKYQMLNTTRNANPKAVEQHLLASWPRAEVIQRLLAKARGY